MVAGDYYHKFTKHWFAGQRLYLSMIRLTGVVPLIN